MVKKGVIPIWNIASEEYLRPYQLSMIEHSTKTVNG